MTPTLQTRLKKAGRWLPVALLPLLSLAAQAQTLNYSAAGATNVIPPPAYMDIAATGAPIATANNDDANSADQPIGFSFNFNGTAFTRFVLNTNGFIKLGTTAPSAAALFLPATGGTNTDPFQSPNAADVNIVAPFNVDLNDGNGTGGTVYSVVTTGTAPNQVCTIQWKNVKDKTGGQFANFSFQVKLYQTTNVIDFTYDAPVASAAAPAFQFSQVGIKGSGFAAGQFVQALKQSGAAWSAATFANSLTGTTLNTLNYRNNVNPVAGTTYRFAPAVANDGAVTLIYTQGQLATFSPAHVVRAIVSNVGSSSYTGTATLTVKRGATTLFTDTKPVATLANGANTTVSFAAYDAATMANVGTNDVTVSIGADDNAANNSKTLDQVVTTTTVNYASPAVATTGGISFGAAGMGNAGSRFTTTTSRVVTSIQAYIANGTGTVAGVLFDATGAELGRSAVRTLVAGDAGTLITFTLTAPVTIAAGDFFAGLNLAAGAAVGAQDEVPTRAATFYQINAGPALVDLATNNLGRFNLGAITTATTATACPAVTALTIGNITTTGATATFTGATGSTGYTVTYTPTGGAATTVTPAPTASPVVLTGLMAGTTYTVSVTTNCGGGQTSAAVTTTFTTMAAGGLTNDDPSGAITIPVAATCMPTNGTNVGATTTTVNGYTNPGCGIAVNPKDVWFKFTTAATGLGSTNVSITVTGAPAGQVRVFSAASAAGPFTSVGCAAGTAINTVAAPLQLGNLTPNKTYYVFVSGYGSGDTQGAFTICATGLATPAPAPYATLPFTEGFEGTWATNIELRDIPSANWRNTPAKGDNSWRREDDGFATLSGSSANWRYPDNEAPTAAFPIPPYVIRSSTGAHSARFHSFGSDAGMQGKLDVYVNMSTPGNKTLTFDYINPTGTDKLEVLVSTDGGATFSAPVLTGTTNAAFTAKTVAINSSSATTVIRFQATSDFGNDDLGIDNVQLRVITATTNAALAATVSLYPNPAHQSFQLSVPAGSLRNASASLSNALGQVVQVRELNLPAAGGIATFDVSRLAAGVYTLTLKSGNDLVVKRVVVE